MSNPEIQGNLEIGTFKSPEELARALEEKSKTEIAGKIRKIAGEVQGNSVDLRKKLQEELSEVEQSQIRETFPDKGVDNIFRKGMSQEERQELMAKSALAGFVGEEATQGLGKIESWMKSISDSFDVAGELFEKGQFMAAFGVILKGLFGQFSLKEWNKKDEEKKGSKGKETESIEKEYILGINAIYSLGNTNKIEIKSVLHSPTIQKKSFSNLKNEVKNSQGIASRLELNAFTDEQVKKEIEILLKSEARIDNLLGKDFPDWREKSLLDLVKLLNQKGFLIIGKLKDKFLGMNFSFNPGEASRELFSALGENLNVSKTDDGKIQFGDIGDGEKLLGDVSTDLILKIITLNKENKINISTKDTELIQSIGGTEKKDHEFLTKFMEFKNAIIPQLKTLLPERNQAGISDFFTNTKRGFTGKDLLELYLITGGETNLQNLGGVKMTLLYIKFGAILSKDADGLAGALANKLHEQIINDVPLIPEEVKNFFSDILSIIGKSVWNKLKGIGKDIYEYTDASTKAIIVGLIGMYFISARTRHIIAGVGGAATAFVALQIWNTLSPEAKNKLKENHKIESAESLDKKLGEVL